MTFDAAQRLTEWLLAVAVAQQALEHLSGPRREHRLVFAQLALAFPLGIGWAPTVTAGLLLILSVEAVRRFQGPYNGGADRLRLLMLSCVFLSHVLPGQTAPQVALGYLAVQMMLSYTAAGWAKLANPDWRQGRALHDVFAMSVYPVSEQVRAWAGKPRLLRGLSGIVLAFEVLFPFALLGATTLQVALGAALVFHVGNACAFGLNRFVWIWLAGYPSLLWFQAAILQGPG